MTFLKTMMACASCAFALQATAAPTYSVSTPTGTFGLPGSFTATGNAGVASGSIYGAYSEPATMPSGAPYLYVSNGGSLKLNINSSSFSFLWGSPDSYNFVTYTTSLGVFQYSGAALETQFGILDSQYGLFDGTTVFNATLAGGTINSVTFTSSDAAFEIAVAQPVPEPSTYALTAVGLALIVFVARRSARG